MQLKQAGGLKFTDRTGQPWQLTLGSQSRTSKEDLWGFAVEMDILGVQGHAQQSRKAGNPLSHF